MTFQGDFISKLLLTKLTDVIRFEMLFKIMIISQFNFANVTGDHDEWNVFKLENLNKNDSKL